MDKNFNDEEFYANIFLNWTSDNEVKLMMQSILDEGLNEDLQDYCLVGVGNAFQKFDE